MKRTFPYAFARVSAMKAKLIAVEDYHKMLKMDLSSITRFLQESEYRKAITKLSAEYSGLELIDRALRQNEAESYSKLRRICPEEVVKVIDLYLSSADYQNLKVVLRGLYSNANASDIKALLEPVGKFDEQHFMKLFETGSVIKALSASKIVNEKDVKESYRAFKDSNKLVDLENQLDHIYYDKAIEGAKELNIYGEAYKSFILRDIDITNMRNLMRFKKEGLGFEDIEGHLLIEGKRLNKKKLLALARKQDLASLLAALSHTYYGKVTKFEGDIVTIELALTKYHMKKAFVTSHSNALTIQTILSYMMRKLIEIRNLRSLVKAKHLGIEPDYVENNLLVV